MLSATVRHRTGDRRSTGEATAWFNLVLVQETMGQPLEAVQRFQQARVLYSSMALDAQVQDCDQALNRLSTAPIGKRSAQRRGWLGHLVGWLLRVMHGLWGRRRNRV